MLQQQCNSTRWLIGLGLAVLMLALPGCMGGHAGREHARKGDEIMIAGRLFHTGTPIVLWFDQGGYDGYRVERRFSKFDERTWEHTKDKIESPNRFNLRKVQFTDDEREAVRGGAWPLDLLRKHVDQFVLHYDASGVSRQCFRTLHDERGLSIHFLLDLDGTIYQTLDVQERAWHATKANDRSIGIEIANIGAYSASQRSRLDTWYSPDNSTRDPSGVRVVIPAWMGDAGIRTPNFVARPTRPHLIEGSIHGQQLLQYDFTPEQYAALAKLTKALSRVLPGIRLDAPRDRQGNVLTSVLSDEDWRAFSGVLGHYHIQENKVDPGPAFDWERFLSAARKVR
jgi:N-acetyl-anhydromuramyl-L-alanine amidase AmpD